MSGRRRIARPVTLAGVPFCVDDDQPTFWERAEAGSWEPATLAALGRLLGPDAAFLDLGAWVGPLTLYAAALGARVVAVEADPRALDQLRRNVAANPHFASRIAVMERAVSATAEPVRLGARRKPGDSMSSVLLATGEESWTVPAVTPLELATRLGPERKRVVKLDIEGGEYALLPAIGPLLDGPDCAFLVAFHPAILRESGAADPDGATRAALAPLAGLRAVPLSAAAPGEGEWLYLKGDAAARWGEAAAPLDFGGPCPRQWDE